MSSDPNDSPQQEPAEPPRPGKKWTTGVAALIVAFVALASYALISGGASSAGRPSAPRTAAEAAPRTTATAAAAARTATPIPGPGTSVTSSPAPSSSSSRVRRTVSVSLLTIASAAAYGPDGTSDGDHSSLAPGIINGGDGQAWDSSWYASPEFGNLQSGTGLMLDMGETVNLSRVQLVLGSPVGADVQVRVGNEVAASAYDVGGTVQLRITSPVRGRYVLIWFTQLPLKQQGEYQVSVYGATVYGTKGTLLVALGAFIEQT